MRPPSPVFPLRGPLTRPLRRLVPALLALQVLDRREHRGRLPAAHLRLVPELRQPVVLPLAAVLLWVPGITLARARLLGRLALIRSLVGTPLALLAGRVLVLRAVAARARRAPLAAHLLLLLLAQGQLEVELGVLVAGLGPQHLLVGRHGSAQTGRWGCQGREGRDGKPAQAKRRRTGMMCTRAAAAGLRTPAPGPSPPGLLSRPLPPSPPW